MQNRGTYTRIGENEFMVAEDVNLQVFIQHLFTQI